MLAKDLTHLLNLHVNVTCRRLDEMKFLRSLEIPDAKAEI